MPAPRVETIPLVDDSELGLSVVEPEGAVRGGIVLLHDADGVTEHVTHILEGLADEGWLAVAPDLYHRARDGGESPDGRSVLADSDASFGWLADHGVPSDRMGVLGFDLGATAALVVASKRSLGAAVTVAAGGVRTPLAAGLPALLDVVGELTCPWLGLYGETGDDVDPADVEQLREAAHASDRVVDVVVYPASEHRFDAAGRADAAPAPGTGEPASDEGRASDAAGDPDDRGTVTEARSRVLNWFDAHLR